MVPVHRGARQGSGGALSHTKCSGTSQSLASMTCAVQTNRPRRRERRTCVAPLRFREWSVPAGTAAYVVRVLRRRSGRAAMAAVIGAWLILGTRRCEATGGLRHARQPLAAAGRYDDVVWASVRMSPESQRARELAESCFTHGCACVSIACRPACTPSSRSSTSTPDWTGASRRSWLRWRRRRRR